jgi:hypothetical protein
MKRKGKERADAEATGGWANQDEGVVRVRAQEEDGEGKWGDKEGEGE